MLLFHDNGSHHHHQARKVLPFAMSRNKTPSFKVPSFLGGTKEDNDGGDDLEGRIKVTNTIDNRTNTTKQQQKEGCLHKIKSWQARLRI